ncbi:SPOR domain-containing protein [Massilia glaciei]|uniref:SPOR domain-containing protein n=1 Tax=Massilia glaciei TaxID=1524097 RepID=A0A2U2I5P8_9BURK|nr:SPOR domain-containing protein [Massilia glaciei]PWF54965.1 SPOR domain-containing protein [Massilia glaciei]
MGLFSFLSKNKQDSAADSGYASDAEEDAIAAKARSKRASSAEQAPSKRGAKGAQGPGSDDPVLPEKKRARRRLVGTIALALAVAVGLPMLLDAEPKPLQSDIAIQIPSKDKVPPLPLPPPVAPSEALDASEEIVDPAATAAQPKPVARLPEPDLGKLKLVEPRVAERKAEPKPAAAKPAEPKPVPKPTAPPEPKPKPAARAPTEAERARAILEGQSVPKAAPAQRYVVQVAALGSQDAVNELQGKLRAAGISSFTQKIRSGKLIQVRVGPFSKEDAEKMRARLGKIGLSGSMVPA